MDEEWKRTMREFEKVWPRVEGKHGPPPPPPPGHGPGKPPPPPEDARELRDFICGESEAERQYMLLAGKTKGKAADDLRRLAAGSRRLVKKLQAEYYLLTGDTCPIPPPPPARECRLAEGLRQAWQAAREAEKEFEDAAARTRCDRLSAVYRDAAEEKRRQRTVLFALLRRVIA